MTHSGHQQSPQATEQDQENRPDVDWDLPFAYHGAYDVEGLQIHVHQLVLEVVDVPAAELSLGLPLEME